MHHAVSQIAIARALTVDKLANDPVVKEALDQCPVDLSIYLVCAREFRVVSGVLTIVYCTVV